jgi:OmcA/MtrC family decaheme c-type cytochrome
MAAAAYQSLKPQIDPTTISVSIPADGKPVVTFKVTDGAGNPVIGLGGQVAGTATSLPANYNLSFTLAKLVPAALDPLTSLQTSPSKWVSYLVTKPATIASGAVATWAGTYPTSDSNGTLVDNNDGTYKYTFLRSITAVLGQVNGLTDTATNLKADLDPTNLAYDATATHRLGIIISGSQPGTGTATPDALQVTNPVPLVNTFNIGYDFVPNGTAVVATRDIVMKDSCSDCHDARAIGHFSTTGVNTRTVKGAGGVTLAIGTVPNGIPPGEFVGRNDPRLCVTCHTDQTKYSFVKVTATGNNYTSAYLRTLDDKSAFDFPRMVHQFHMGKELTKTGYNLNGHCNDPRDTSTLYDATKATANSAACYNTVGWPQSPADCTKCHDGSPTKSDGTVNTKKTANGDNWMNNPSIKACGACHDGIDFTTGTGVTLADKATDVANKVPVGTTHTGHLAGASGAPTDADCATCHVAASHQTGSIGAEIALYHRTPFSTLNNPKTPVGLVNFSYDVKSVTVNSSGQPVITFQIKKDDGAGGALTAVTELNIATPVRNGQNGQMVIAGTFEPITGFADGPSLYAAFAVPQDGIATPADFNARFSVKLANLLVPSGSPKQGSLSNALNTAGTAYVADTNGYFTATLTGDLLGQAADSACDTVTLGTSVTAATCIAVSTTSTVSNKTPVLASPIVIPTSAVMLTGMIVEGFTQKSLAGSAASTTTIPTYVAAGVATNPNSSASGGLLRPAVLKKMVATGYTGRRVITDTSKCAKCHDQLGTEPSFHGGARNDPTACAICHNPNRTSNGWTANANTFVHGIHGASKRTVPFTWAGASATDNYSMVGYPGLLKDCSQCHLPNTVNFGNTGGTTLLPNMLWPTEAASTISATSNAFRNYPAYIATGVNYGPVFSYVAAGATVSAYSTSDSPLAAAPTTPKISAHVAGASGEAIPADGATLVTSPITAACFACHDTSAAKNHMTSNGGKIYATRNSVAGVTTYTITSALPNGEDCLTCHGAGRLADSAVIHARK